MEGIIFQCILYHYGTLTISYNLVNYTLIKKKAGWKKKRTFPLPQKETPSSLAVIPYFPSHQPLTTANLSVSRDFLFQIFHITGSTPTNGIVQRGAFCIRLLALGTVFSSFTHVVTCVCTSFLFVLLCSVVSDSFVTPWTVAHRAPLSMAFPRQEYWSGLPFPTPGIFPTQGWNPCLLLGTWETCVYVCVCVCVYTYIHTSWENLIPV